MVVGTPETLDAVASWLARLALARVVVVLTSPADVASVADLRSSGEVDVVTAADRESLLANLKLLGTLDVVVANPPYVGAEEELPEEVAAWEPPGALVAGPLGTEDLDHLVAEAVGWLHRTGTLVLELAPHQAEIIADRARAAGFADVSVVDDLSGRARAVVARRV